MKKLQDAGQSIWLDSISREILRSGTFARYVEDLCVTGLTSNPTIFERAISAGNDYDEAIESHRGSGLSAEALFFELALEDITEAADLLRPVHVATGGVDGFASIEVSPTLANDAKQTISEAKSLFARAKRSNVLIKVPGTREGCVAIEELIFAGTPINVTLLFSRSHYSAAAEAYVRGVERRLEAGLDPNVPSVASLFISRWDAHTASVLAPDLANKAGIVVAQRTYRVYQELLESERWQRLEKAGAHPQRLLWASTGTKDPALPDTYYITALAAQGTVNTMPEKTLLAFADHGEVGELMTADTAEADATVERVRKAGFDPDALASRLQTEGAALFVESWNDLLQCLEARRRALHAA